MTYVVAHLEREPDGTGQYDTLNLYRFTDWDEACAFADGLDEHYGPGHCAGWPGAVVLVNTEDPAGWCDPAAERERWGADDYDAEAQS